jgi:hypothetical protein
MSTIAEIEDRIRQLIEKHPSRDPLDLTELLEMVQAVETPVIAVYVDGGLIHDVERLNDAPFSMFVHDHDIEGSADVSEVHLPGGKVEPAVISSYDHTDVTRQESEPFWNSLRKPVDMPLLDDGDE